MEPSSSERASSPLHPATAVPTSDFVPTSNQGAIQALLGDSTREHGKQYQVFLLLGPEDPDTVRLARPILNDTITESCRPWAWT
jgi:hypothetical protein